MEQGVLIDSRARQELLSKLKFHALPPYIVLGYRVLTQPSLQSGPTCGLWAASCCAELLGVSGVGVDTLLSTARELGVTAQGEMFSAASLARVLNTAVEGRVGAPRARCCSGFDTPQSVVAAVARGALLMVPYDADRNHAPCLRAGRSSHWALVVGAFLSSSSAPPVAEDFVSHEAASGSRWAGDVCVLLACRHGKSRHVAVWSHKELAASNGQLAEARTPRPGEKPYVISDGGVREGLAGKYVLVENGLEGASQCTSSQYLNGLNSLLTGTACPASY